MLKNKKQKLKIFFVAPLPNTDRNAPTFLAAHKKIFFLLDALYSQGIELVFINSGPEMRSRQETSESVLKLHSENCIPYFSPLTYSSTKLGRLKNIIDAPKILERAIKKFGIPDLLWCYNGYAYEMHTAKYAFDKHEIKCILEFEDWHFARSSFTKPKAILDWLFWRRSISSIGFSFVVNIFLKKKMEYHGVSTDLLPGVVSDHILDLSEKQPPFENRTLATVNCGYFGGLCHEKGGSFLLELIQKTISNNLPIKWVITGSGELANDFINIAKRHPLQVTFHGMVDDIALQELIGSVDVILNPHLLNNGVFPFKVMEAVASGRLVLSSPLQIPSEIDWLLASILVEQLDVDAWMRHLLKSHQLYHEKLHAIKEALIRIRSAYSGIGLNKKIMVACREAQKKSKPNIFD